MPKYSSPEFDIIKSLQNDIKDLRRQITALQNAKTLSANIYSKATLAQRDLMPGQIILGKDNTLNYCTGSVDQVSVYEIQGTLFTTL